MTSTRNSAVSLLAAALAATVLATGNLTALGIGSSPVLYDYYALPRFVLAYVLIFCAWAAVLRRTSQESRQLHVDSVWGMLAALALWAVVSALLSPHRVLSILGQSERLEGVATIILYVLAYGVALQAVRALSDARFLLAVLTGATIILAVHGLLQFMGVDPFTYGALGSAFEGRRAFATFGNPNFLAGLLVLVLPVSVGLYADSTDQRGRLVWSMAAAVIGAALLATFTRGAWLAFVAELGVGALVWLNRARVGRTDGSGKWRLMAGVVLGGIVLVLVISLTSQGEVNVVQRLADLRESGSIRERSLTARSALEAAAARPVFGYGPDAFLPAFRLHRSADYARAFGASATINNAHSWPLQYAATLGFPGAALLCLALVVALVRSRRSVFATRQLDGRAASRSAFMIGTWVGCLGFAVHMLSSVAVIGATVPFWMLLGILGAPKAKPVDIDSRRLSALVVTAVVLALVAAVGGGSLVAADAVYLRSRDAYAAKDFASANELAVTARSLNPLSVKYRRGAAQAAGAMVDAAVQNGASEDDVRRLMASAREQYDSVLSVHPNDYPARAWLAAVTGTSGQYLQDAEQIAEAGRAASAAARLDRQHEQVQPIIVRDFSAAALEEASSVPGLP